MVAVGLVVVVGGGGWVVVVVERQCVMWQSRTTGFGNQRPAGRSGSYYAIKLVGNKCQRGSTGYSACCHVPFSSWVQFLHLAFFFDL